MLSTCGAREARTTAARTACATHTNNNPIGVDHRATAAAGRRRVVGARPRNALYVRVRMYSARKARTAYDSGATRDILL